MASYKNRNNEECKGCLILIGCERHPFHKKINDEDMNYCPCINCIVKMVCKIPCPEFKKYTISYYSYLDNLILENRETKIKVTKNEKNR